MSKHVTAERARERVGKLRAQTIAGTKMAGSLQLLDDYIAQTEAREAALVELLTECRKAMARYDYDCYEEGVSMPYRERTLREEVDLAIAAHRGDEES